ncbi:9628_t:CDS:2 [Ambispora leptoticha]|uniref:9628_t:CDS:1 n=1 Tax=Ambispora leptoticha TaxID=144679 RepID=A0A9N9D3M1_9GLOM|nr:9628_t:CDS:2 [Ambispora leptoticha]
MFDANLSQRCILQSFHIDTPGFDDSDEDKSDEETVFSIFLKMLEAKIQNITTILWFVVPDVRTKTSYKLQARFIESLAKYYSGNVWDNTIIVTKGDTINNGPRDHAREISQKEHNTKNDLLSKIDELLMKGILNVQTRLNIRKFKYTECVHKGNIIDIYLSLHVYKHNYYVGFTTKQVFDNSPQAWIVRVFSLGGANPSSYLDTGIAVTIMILIHEDASMLINEIIDLLDVKKFTIGARHKLQEKPCLTIL